MTDKQLEKKASSLIDLLTDKELEKKASSLIDLFLNFCDDTEIDKLFIKDNDFTELGNNLLVEIKNSLRAL